MIENYVHTSARHPHQLICLLSTTEIYLMGFNTNVNLFAFVYFSQYLRVFFDVFRQTLCFNLRRSKQSSFYVFGVFVDCRGGGTPDNVFLRVYFNVFDKVRVFIFAHQNRVRCMALEFLQIVEGGGPLINVFLRVYFDVFRQSWRFNIRPSKQRPFYVFGVFVDRRGRGTPVKRIHEGLFRRFSTNFVC